MEVDRCHPQLMSPATDEDADRDLYLAIGRLVTESARFEEQLKFTLHSFFMDDHVTLLFTGQNWEWYVESIKTVVEQFHRLTWQAEREQLLDILNASRELRESRNWVVHGVWEHNCWWDDECIASPTATEDPDRLYHFLRSRMRKDMTERQFTVTDIEILTDRISELGSALRGFQKSVEGRI